MRRRWLIGSLVLLAVPAMAAEPASRRRRPVPRTRPAANRVGTSGAAPPIDPAPAPARGGFEPAPTPARNALPPASDRGVRTSVDFGVPAPREPQQGNSFRVGDPTVESRTDTGNSLRVPAPGATVRVPF